MNLWFALSILFMWLGAALGTKYTKDETPLLVALIGTIVLAFFNVLIELLK